MEGHKQPSDGALPFSDVTGLLAAAAGAEKQQALVARIFVPPPVDPASSSSVDRFAHLTSLAQQLEEYTRNCSRLSDELGGQTYIWHREPPSISVVSPPSSLASSSKQATQLPPHILFHLRTGGECIEDEWFATHLLIGASSHFAKHRLCISIEDEDGQFLLIEAAEYLPEWVTPEAVTNRVWIYDGHLHLIPPHHKSSDDGALTASRAVELVTDESTVTRASDEIEAAAFARAYEFPSAATSHHHRTLAYLPRRVARVLAAEPQLIANCISSIQSRDVVSSRSGSRLVHFPPPQAPTASTSTNALTTESESEIVLTRVRMTRHLYAQLLYDRFFPPRQLGPQWQAAVEKYRLRLHGQQSEGASQAKVEDEEEVQTEMHQGRWHDLGAKIWCGMEMAYTESLARRTRTRTRPMATSEVGIAEPERKRLMRSLSKLGYFQGEMEGSAKWKTLEAEAVAQYLRGSSTSDKANDASTDEALLCETVDCILQQPSPASFSTMLPPDASPPTIAAAEDSDSWLHLTPNDIDSILQSKTSSSDPTSAISQQDTFQRLSTFNTKMEDFVKTRSDARGALFEDEVEEDDMALDDDDLLFEDLDEEEAEERVRREVEERMRADGEGEKRRLVERLIPRMSDAEWTRRPNPTETTLGNEVKEDFLSSIDKISADRTAGAAAEGADMKDVATRDNNLSAAHAELRRRLASQYMRDTSTLLSSQGHEVFDGVSDSDSSELEQETSPEVRRQRAEEYDLEPDPPADEVEAWQDVEMDEQTELDNLLEFARVSLGLTPEQYEGILEQRREKGKFVPTAKAKGPVASRVPATPKESPSKSIPKGEETEPPKLDTFESVMAAMEEQLHTLQSSARPPPSSAQTDPKLPTMGEKEDEELLAHLLRSGSDLPSSLLRQLGDEGKSEQIEAFLRSFQAQAGTSGPGAGSGPVDVLMRRFGLGGLPADQDAPQ